MICQISDTVFYNKIIQHSIFKYSIILVKISFLKGQDQDGSRSNHELHDFFDYDIQNYESSGLRAKPKTTATAMPCVYFLAYNFIYTS